MKHWIKKIMILILITAISLNTNIQKLSAAEKIMSSQIKHQDSIISEKFILTDSGELIPLTSEANLLSNEDRIVLYEQILSVKKTKELADTMKLVNSGSLAISEIADHLKEIGGFPGPFIAYVTKLSAKSSFRSNVITAAKNNKRVKLIVTDSATLHTSYSVQIEYQIV